MFFNKFRTMKSRFAGQCQRCKKAGLSPDQCKIEPGQTIRWAKHAGAYHLANQCPAKQAEPVAVGAADNDGFDCGDSSDAN